VRVDASWPPGCGRQATHHRLAGTLLALAVGFAARPCNAYDVMLRWTAGYDAVGYRVYTGSRSRAYSQRTDVGAVAGDTVNGVVYYLYRNVASAGKTYVAVTAYSAAGLESDYSNERVFDYTAATPPPADTGPDQSAPVGATLTLGSKPQAGVSYFWDQLSGPPATLSNRAISNPRFSAATAGTFTFALTAYDAQGVATRKSVSVTLIGSGPPPPTVTPTPRGAGDLIRGNRRSPKNDRSGCQVEWLVANAATAIDRFGLPSQNQVCEDGDPSCDFKVHTPGLCEFHVQVCLNNVDPSLPMCAQNGVGAVSLLAPRVRTGSGRDSNAMVAANVEALSSALEHLRDPSDPQARQIYSPPLDDTQQGFCSAPFAIQAVASRGTRPSVTIKTRSGDDSRPRRHISVSQLRLICKQAAQ
jgi:hypothetical protein